MKRFFYLLISLFLLSGFSVIAQCGIQDTVIAIPDNETPLEIKLMISGVSNDNLADTAQGVCAVYLHYEHFQRKDLTIDLISPSGQKVTLVGPRDPFNKFPLSGKIEWDISFVGCNDIAAPDPGKSDQFDNLDPSWGFGYKYTGVYYPNKGCLEDFNVGQVNGLWTLVVFDHDHFNKGNFLGFTIVFCDGSTVDCDLCHADAGYFKTNSASFCVDDHNVHLDLQPVFHDSIVPDSNLYEYKYIIYGNGILIDFTTKPDLDSLAAGLYNICGFSYLKEDSTAIFDLLHTVPIDDFVDSLKTPGTPFCADMTDNCFGLEIYGVNNLIDLDTAICVGDTLELLNQSFDKSGDYYVASPGSNCETAYNLHLRVVDLDADILAQDSVLSCNNANILLQGTGFIPNVGISFKWNKKLKTVYGDTTAVLVGQPGEYFYVLNLGKCTDTAFINIASEMDFPILDFEIQNIDCVHDSALLSVRSLNTSVDSVVWTNEFNQSFYGDSIITADTGYYLANVYAPGGCMGFEEVQVIKDTIPPFIYLTGNDISCSIDTSFLHLNSPDSLLLIYWNEFGFGSKDTFTINSGKYHVEVTGINGCISEDSIIVEEYKTPIDYAIYFDTINCYNDTAFIDFQSSGSINNIKWITPDFDTVNSEDLYVILPGKYYCIVEDGNGCIVEDSVNIVRDVKLPDLQISIPEVYLSCSKDSVRLSFNSGSIIKNIKWTGPGNYISNKFSPFVSISGVYIVTITGENGCENSGEVNVLRDNSVPNITIIPDTISCVDDTANITIIYTGNYDFKWLDPDDNTLSGDNITSVLGGYYYLTVTDLDNNCDSRFSVFVPVDTIVPDISVNTSNAFDCSHNKVKLFLDSDVPLKEVIWSGNNYNFSGDTATVYISGMYYVEAISSGYCISYDSIYLNNSVYLDIKDDTFYLDCNNGRQVTIELNDVLDTFNFLWEGPSFSSNSSAPVVTEGGLYKVTVSDGDCIDSANIWILYDTLVPDIDVVYDPEIKCNPDFSIINAILDTTLIDTFYWQGPGYSSNKLIDTVYSPGQYIFKALGKNGCSSSYIINISLSNEYPEIKAIGDTVNCMTGIHDLVLDAEIIGEYTGLIWSGPNGYSSTSKTNVVSDTGKYYLVITNSSGCISKDSTWIVYDIVLPRYQVVEPEKITCFNDSIELMVNGLDSGLVYNWQGPYGFYSEDNDFYVKRGGNYILKVMGLNGCFSIDTVNVKIDKLRPYISVSAGKLNCLSPVTTIEIYTNTDDYSVKWTGPGSYNSTDYNPQVSTDGMYYVELTDKNNGCMSDDSIYINYDTIKPKVFINDFYLPCDTTKIRLTISNQDLNSQYFWFGPDTFYAEGKVAYTDIAGKYNLNVIGENGCDTTLYFNVFDIPVNPDFEVFGNNINCTLDSVILRAVGVSDDLSFDWSGPNGFISYDKEPVVKVPGDYILHVVGKNKCDSSAVITVSIDTLKPNIEIEYLDSLVCEKQTGKLNLKILNDTAGYYSYYWYSDTGLVTFGKYTANPFFQGEGKYIVEVKNLNNNCEAMDSILIKSKEYNLDSVKINIVPPTCYGFSDGMFSIDTAFGGKPPYRYSIDNFYFSNIKDFTSKTSGTYNVYVKDKNGCRLDTMLIVPDGSSVQLQLTTDKDEIYPGESIKLIAYILADNKIVNYFWQPANLFDLQDTVIQIIKPLDSGEIFLKVVDSKGCYDEDNVWIKVRTKPEIYIPDIFSPDYDNINDYFYVKAGKGVKAIRNFYIFDRWGEKIFEKSRVKLNSPVEGWDGKYRGQDVPPGVYVYYFELELENGEIERIAGDITLIR